MSSGLLTVQSVGGTGPSYVLTVASSTGVATGDHVVAQLLSDSSRGGIYRVTSVPDSTTINVEDDLVPGGGTYGAPTSGSGAYWTPTSDLGISTAKELFTPFWADITERDTLLLEEEIVENSGTSVETLTYTDTSNEVIGPLTKSPTDEAQLNLFVFTGILQEYTLDYTVREVVGGTAPGYYVCVSPTSTAPGGGSFGGGSNPGTGIASVLVSGDKTRVTYPV